MSQVEKKWFPLIIGLILVILVASVGVSTGQSGLPANACTTSNGLCSPISFDTFVFGNSTLIDVTQLQSQAHSIIANQSIVVVARGESNGFHVKSVIDTAGDTFISNVNNSANGNDLEIWTTVTSQTVSNIITVTWNFSNNAIFGAAYYFNVRKIANVTSAIGGASPATVTLETTQGGSWIVGGLGTAGNCSIFTVTTGISRGQVCNSSVNDNVITLLDNATTLSNRVFSTLTASYNAVQTFQAGAVELIASDQEPNNPNFNLFCTTINGLCVTSQYKLNFAGVASLATGNLALTAGTAYCTGLTTTALVLTTSDKILAIASFGGNDRNVTGVTVLLQLYVTSIAPSTVFGAGQCSASQTLMGTSTLNWGSFVGTGASNAQSAAIVGDQQTGTFSAGTYYAYVEMTPYNFGTAGHMLWLSSLGQSYSLGSIGILDVR